MKIKKTWAANLLFALMILALAGGLLIWRNLSIKPGAALMAQLTYGDDNTVLDISLDKDATYDVDTGYYTVHIEVASGAARFIDSPCPDHICEHYGWLSAEDQFATCMPARATLMIVPAA